MCKIYAMNIFLFIFLFHFVSNKESFFLKRKDTAQKIEFSLNVTTVGGKNFFNLLKEIKTTDSITMIIYRKKAYKGTIENLNAPKSIEGLNTGCYKGEIIAEENLIYICTDYLLYPKGYEKIGNTSTQPELSAIFDTTANEIYVEFQLVEESNETPKKRQKSGNWKTMKMLKRVKELKRYRIVKKMEKLKGLKN